MEEPSQEMKLLATSIILKNTLPQEIIYAIRHINALGRTIKIEKTLLPNAHVIIDPNPDDKKTDLLNKKWNYPVKLTVNARINGMITHEFEFENPGAYSIAPHSVQYFTLLEHK